MKSYRQPKRKRVELSRNPDECMDVTVNKPANGTVGRHYESKESITMTDSEPPTQLQIPSTKIKLQLFPINEQTRLVLDKDGHNPFLELTLSARKRVSSVVKHLNAKWGSSIKVIGDLVLFPYNTKLEQLTTCRRWTSNDLAITAWEVYIDLGSPSIFRLRYGCFSNLQQGMFDTPSKSSLEAHTCFEGSRGWPRVLEIPNHQEEKITESYETIKTQTNVNVAVDPDVNELKPCDAPTDIVDDQVTTVADPVCSTVPWDANLTNLSIGDLLSEISLQGSIRSDPNSSNRSGVQPVGLLSDISIGDLLSEASLMGRLGKMSNTMKLENESSWQRIFLAPSDVSIGGLLSEASLHSNKNKLDAQTMEAGHRQIQSQWDDTFTTLSIGGLLFEASLQAKACGNPELKEGKSSLEPNAFSHSFDSLISAHSHAHSPMAKPSCDEPNLSILDAEETCHAFPIREHQPGRDVAMSNARISSSGCNNATCSKQSHFSAVAKEPLVSLATLDLSSIDQNDCGPSDLFLYGMSVDLWRQY